MALTELARMQYTLFTILEKASSAVGLSKRAAIALAILYLEDGPDAKMTNHDLQDRFLKYNASTGLSTKKDASASKSELLVAKLIEIRGKVSVFALTEQGRETVLKMHDVVNEALKELKLSEPERSLLRRLIGLPAPKPSASATTGRSVRQKSS